MNILIDNLPDTVVINETDYPIHTDFRLWIRFELLMLGRLDEKKVAGLLIMCYKQLPSDLREALRALMGFYAGCSPNGQEGEAERSKPIYSFEHDADYIYAAFMAQYGIDLQVAELHWWQFKALFKSLNDTNQIVKIMEYRSIDLSKIKDKEQRKHYRKMKALYKLPDPRSEEEKERDMIDSLSKLF